MPRFIADNDPAPVSLPDEVARECDVAPAVLHGVPKRELAFDPIAAVGSLQESDIYLHRWVA